MKNKIILLAAVMLPLCVTSMQAQTMKKDTVVILDAGHGGLDPVTQKYVTPGKRSPIWEDGTQYFEGVGNRDIVLRATHLLSCAGVQVLHTVDPSSHIDMSLTRRIEIANEHFRKHNRKPFLISVHSNGFSNESANGTEVFTSPGQTRSDQIATIWMDEFRKLFPDIRKRTDFTDGDIDKEAKFRIIAETRCPAILIETMFHTNRRECAILMNPKKRQLIAQAIAQTVLRA